MRLEQAKKSSLNKQNSEQIEKKLAFFNRLDSELIQEHEARLTSQQKAVLESLTAEKA